MEIDQEAFMSWCKKQMANYKAPKRVEVMTELPVNPGGKVQKFNLRKLL